MQLNQARCDWVTLTTFDHSQQIMGALGSLYLAEDSKRVKIGGYEGALWEGLFYGTSQQRGKFHFMMRGSGEDAETIFWRTSEIDANCTRLDLQITIDIPAGYESRKLYDALANKDTSWPARVRGVSIIQSGDKLDTIYIGSRTSERFFRIYVKPDVSGNPAYLRFEVEFKKSMARAIRHALIEKTHNHNSILKSELNRLPRLDNVALLALSEILGMAGANIKPATVYGQNNTIDWLETQVEGSVLRMLHSHQHGDRMKMILLRWLGNVREPEDVENPP